VSPLSCPAIVIQPLVYGLGVFAILELLYAALRRWPVRVRMLYHVWALVGGVVAALAVTVGPEAPAWKTAASIGALLTAFVLYSLLDSLVFQRPWQPALGPIMPKLARDVLRIVVLAAVAIVVATVILRQPLPAVLVSSTVVSAVVGLALQDVLKNVFTGVAIELERPFERGDWLLLDGKTVQVVDTSWRSVRLRTRDGLDLWEPNSVFATSRVVNYGSGARPVGINFEVHVTYDSPPARVKAALLAVARSVPGAERDPAPEAFVTAFGDSGVDYRLRVWTRQLAQLNRFTDAVNSRIWYELRRQGLDVPFPTRIVRWHDAAREEQRAEETHLEQATALLAHVHLFEGLAPDVVARLAAAATYQRFDDGELLVREGEHGDSLYVVEQGSVAVTKRGAEHDTRITLATLGRGGFFGEMSLLTGEPRSATVTADGGCEVMVVAGSALAPLVHADPRLAELFTRSVMARQAQTAATLEGRRERALEQVEARAEATLLQRIRSFFGVTS